jgi:hypothetical protein
MAYPTNPGISINKRSENVTTILSIHGPTMKRTTTKAKSFGIKLKVISWICVAA